MHTHEIAGSEEQARGWQGAEQRQAEAGRASALDGDRSGLRPVQVTYGMVSRELRARDFQTVGHDPTG